MKGEDGEPAYFYNCPLRFVPPSCDIFLERKRLVESGFCAPPQLRDLPAWDADAYFFYQRWFNHFEQVKNRSDYGDLG